jgi:two-component system, LytTR family, response regulator
MKAIIIEDEELAAEGLSISLRKVEADIEILAVLDSVKTAVAWLKNNPAPDLAFLDIQLADGLSFEIFEQTPINCPVIFTTAYDEYALRAFRVNSIDYLLKPIGTDDLKRTFEKLRLIKGETTAPNDGLGTGPYLSQDLIKQVMAIATQQVKAPQYKTRFMIKIGEHLQTFPVEDIDFLLGENKIVWLYHKNGRKYIVDYTLDQLEDLLEPNRFFRLNRQFIASIETIKDVISYSNSRLKIVFQNPPNKEDIIMSREKVEAFKNWMGK